MRVILLLPMLHVLMVGGNIVTNGDNPDLYHVEPQDNYISPQQSVNNDPGGGDSKARQDSSYDFYNILFGDFVNSNIARITNNSFVDSMNSFSSLGRGIWSGASSLLRQGGGGDWHLKSCDDECAYWIMGSMGIFGLGRVALAPATGFTKRQGGRPLTNIEVWVNNMSTFLEKAQKRSAIRTQDFWNSINEAERKDAIQAQKNRNSVVSMITNMRDSVMTRVRVAQRRNAKRDQETRARATNFLRGLRDQVRVAQARSEKENRDYFADIRNLFGFGKTIGSRSSENENEREVPQTLLGGLLGALLENNTPKLNVGGRRLDEGEDHNNLDQLADYSEFNENYVK